MRNSENRLPLIVVLLMALGLASTAVRAHVGEGQKKDTILLRVGSSAWTYTHAQLLAMATDSIPSTKGTRKKPAITLTTLLFKDTKLSPEKIQMVFIIADKITVLRGNDLAYLHRLVLATGPDKDGKPHPWSLAAKDEEAYRALAPHMGGHRKKDVYRIDIVRKAGGAR